MVCSSFWTQAKMFLHLVYRKMTTCQLITMTIPILLQENDPMVPSGGPSPDCFLGSTLNLLHYSAHIVLRDQVVCDQNYDGENFLSFQLFTQLQTLPKTLHQSSDVSLHCGLIFCDGCLNGKQVIIPPSLYHVVWMVKLPWQHLPPNMSSSDY